uniref:Vacuolar iron transporter n=1 Tax=Oryza barthii TaxID=65489 RepID=A0A0D3G1Z5_9ORYZ
MAAMMNNERSSSNKLQVDAENPAAVGDELDLAARANWLRAAVLGANDGLVSTASLMLGVGAVKAEARAMVISGFAGLLAGACSMAIGEFVSVVVLGGWAAMGITFGLMRLFKASGI